MVNTIITITLIVIGLIGVAGLLYMLVFRHRPRRALDQQYFADRWKELQKMLSDKPSWPKAIVAADDLLEEALKKKRIHGKGFGERLVKVQRTLTNNDGAWFGHKLRRKLDHEPDTKLKEAEVKQALVGIRQALKDLGALPDGQPRDTK